MRRAIPALAAILLGAAGARAQESGPAGTERDHVGLVARDRPVRPADDTALGADLAAFEPEMAGDFAFRRRVLRDSDRGTIHAVEFPSGRPSGDAENDLVKAELHLPGEGKVGAGAVILHHLADDARLERAICGALATRGIAALLVWMPYYGDRGRVAGRRPLLDADLRMSVRRMRQAVSDARRALAVLGACPEVRGSRVGLLGVSLGAIVGAVAAGVDGAVDRTVLVLGGADLPEILLHPSRETSGARRRIEALGLSREELRSALMPIEPARYACRIGADRALLINAENDRVIPRAATERLRDAIGMPRLHWYKGDHVTAGLAHFPAILDLAADHLAGGAPTGRGRAPAPRD